MPKSFILLAVLCGIAIATVPGQELRAQDKNQAGKQDDSQQRGRLFRRFRDDLRSLTGADKGEKEKSPQRDANGSQTPRLAQRPTNSAVQPNQGRFDGIRVPEPTNPGDRAPGFRLSDQPPGNNTAPAPELAPIPNKPPRKGFGLTLEEKGEQLVVDSVARNGNAAEADFKRGDVILEIGGVPVKSIAEFDDITGILGEGDQVEVSVSRNGKEEKRLLQNGSIPDAEAMPAPMTHAPATQAVPRGPSLVPSLANDFVPSMAPDQDPPFTQQLPGSAEQNEIGSSVLANPGSVQQSGQKNAALLQMQETIRRQQLMIEQLQRELQARQGSNRRKN